ncbi:hypothetical protein [Terrabacter carboxydivorans]|uniref:Acetone carboxylase n=1 Tax=Terrabacter carboxydivorans TaxID=619730 RepID=A0ABP5Y8W6_9MICO
MSGPLSAAPQGGTDLDHVCSAKGCRAAAVHAVVWNNPKLHTADRRKVWLACNDHQKSLADFVALRGFLIEVVPVGQLADTDG